ncbi:MAG: hypothetical protein DRG25_06880 [Deltaproteobacteria bacterium]|nr:MAG: hypothetical protein DRG25_06880 [Deltaproteobacteria bacterium]
MKKPTFLLTFILAFSLLSAPGFCLTGTEIARLKQAGVSESTIGLMVREKTTETGAFTVEEVLALKEAGLGEEAIQKLIKAGSFLQNRGVIVYGEDLKPLSLSTTKDIIELKKAGLGDEIIKAVITFCGSEAEEEEREKAWEMLKNTGIIIDFRRRTDK